MEIEFTEVAKSVIKDAAKKARKLGHGYVGTEHLLLALTSKKDTVAAKALELIGYNEKKILELLESTLKANSLTIVSEKPGNTPKLDAVIEGAKELALAFKQDKAGTEHLLLSIYRTEDSVALRILTTAGDSETKTVVDNLLNPIITDSPLSREQIYRYAISVPQISQQASFLEKYSRDLTQIAYEGNTDPVIGRDNEISRMVQVLSRRTKNNPCLIGEPGVGKSAIAQALAQRIVMGLVPEQMKNKRILNLDLSGMVAGTKYRGEFEERMKKLIDEASGDPDLVLFIDEIHTLIGAGGAEGALDAANILKPALARGEIQVIGATTIDEYRKHIEKDAALERRFQPITVEESTEEEAIEILKGIAPNFERHHNVKVTEDALEACVTLSKRYITDRFLPDKAIDVMDEAMAALSLSKHKDAGKILDVKRRLDELEIKLETTLSEGKYDEASMARNEQLALRKELASLEKKAEKVKNKNMPVMTVRDVSTVISGWTKIPVNKLEEKETARLRKLEETLHKRIIGQEDAVSAVARAVKRGRVGLKEPNRPIGSFLFLGPTGVGKTEVSKALAEAVFGSENAMIRVDMSEYMEKHSVSKMIGSPPGYVGFDEGGQLSEKVRRNPYSLILFDEIEKAHGDVFNILLQILDEGHLTDAQGRKIDFKNTIIIMTSNAGAQAIVEPKKLGFGASNDESADYKRMKEGVMEEVRRIFKPEFLNRIDETIVFRMLNKDDMTKIITLLSKSLINRCKSEMGIELNLTAPVKKKLVDDSFDAKYGARPLRRKIQTDIEDALCEEVLEGRIKAGDSVNVTLKNKKIVFQSKGEK